MLKRKERAQAIREAIDFYPGGLCFAMPDGRPILVNRRMNELAYILTGHTVMDAGEIWAELGSLPDGGGREKLDRPWLPAEDGGAGEQMVFRLPDGGVWRFRRELLPDAGMDYVQLEASEITELYALSEELYENNARLKNLRGRQENLLENIVQINREKELLSVKMRVHDELGQCLVATKKSLRGGSAVSDAPELVKLWKDAIGDLTNIPLEENAGASPMAELLQVAEMIGCRVDFSGELPAERPAQLLLCAAVREALTNAVRHADADRLTVVMRATDFGWRAEISDNGRAAPASIREGGGLSGLRQRLEREGASLEVRCRDGVSLIVDIPCGGAGGTERANDEHTAGGGLENIP